MLRKTIIPWAAVILWMLLIFWFSAQGGEQSGNLSLGITKLMISTFQRAVPWVGISVDSFHLMLRKGTHFFVYLVLGLLVVNGVWKSGVRGRKAFILALAIGVLYAGSDEFHQLFVPGRSGQLTDVLIDSAGVFLGSRILFSRLKRKAPENSLETEIEG